MLLMFRWFYAEARPNLVGGLALGVLWRSNKGLGCHMRIFLGPWTLVVGRRPALGQPAVIVEDADRFSVAA